MGLRSGIERMSFFLIVNELPSSLQEIFKFAIGQGPLGRLCFACGCHRVPPLGPSLLGDMAKSQQKYKQVSVQRIWGGGMAQQGAWRHAK